MSRVTPRSLVFIPVVYLLIHYVMESGTEISMPSSNSWASWFYIVGVLVSAVFVVKIALGISQLIKLYVWPRISSKKNYVEMYGKWAVITGGSDGIGKGYAMELAHRGMNIFILSNRENNVVSEIKNTYKNVDVRHMDVDFSSPDVYEQIDKEITLLDDVGILINNVGMFQGKLQPLVEQKRGFLKAMMNVNMSSMVLMTEIVLRRMMVKNRGLIVNMSSLSTMIPLPFAAMYSSSKAFIENYSVCLGAELNEVNVQVKCIQPVLVNTQLLRELDSVTDFLTGNFFLNIIFVDPRKFAASVVATFGHATPIMYAGYWSHEILTALIAFTSVGKERIAATIKTILRWLTHEV